jgi:LmbE family N-acetylglucosaminyl deacetylase
MQVLCLVAHPDDEVLGMAGVLAKHAADGDDVHVCLLSDGVTSRHEELTSEVKAKLEQRKENAREACEILGASVSFHDFPDNQFDTVALLDIVQTVESEIADHQPEVVYTHHYGDLNVDHELTARAVVTATRPLRDSSIDRVLAGEVLSSTEWSVPEPSNAFQPTTFVDISDHLQQKLDALACYEEELRDHPHPRTVENVRRNARLWGGKSGVEAAEPFELLRAVR